MTVWLWILIGLCAAGVLLPAVALLQALVSALRLQKRFDVLRESSFVTKLESLQIQLDRLSRTSQAIEELKRRADAALEQMRTSLRNVTGPIAVSVNATRAELRALKEDLS